MNTSFDQLDDSWHMNRTSDYVEQVTDMDDPVIVDSFPSEITLESPVMASPSTISIDYPTKLTYEDKVVEVDYKAVASQAKQLVLWKKPIQSGIVFGTLFTIEIVLMSLSFLSIVGYAGLGLLFALIGFRTFLKFSGKPDTYGILEKLDHKLELTSDEAVKSIKTLIEKVETVLENLRELLLVKNVGNSLKFGLGLYMLTYIGARFNFLTLCLVSTICVFVFPKVYEMKKPEIDKFWELAKEKFKEINNLLMAKLKTLPIPGLNESKDKIQ